MPTIECQVIMQQMEAYRIVRAVIAAGCVVAGSICVAVGYLVPGLLMAGKNYSNPEQAFAEYLSAATGLFVIGGVLYLVGAGLAIWSLRYPPGSDGRALV